MDNGRRDGNDLRLARKRRHKPPETLHRHRKGRHLWRPIPQQYEGFRAHRQCHLHRTTDVGSELAEAQRKINAKYLYNKVHDSDSTVNMMKYLDAAYEQQKSQEARVPENSETANLVNLGIKRLQQLVQQPP